MTAPCIQKTKVDLSITMVSYNTCELTRQCLQSIYKNQGSITLEIFVVDNNSSDSSSEMIENEFTSVHLIRNKDNKGLAAATNQGLYSSSGRYVLALNSDTVIEPRSLETLVKFMDDHPEVGGATPKLILPDGGEHPRVWGNVPTLKSELLDILSPLNSKIAARLPSARYGNDEIGEHSREIPCVLWGTCFIVRREVFEQVGGQDPRFFVYGEDVDWSMRITATGKSIYYVPEAVVIHYGGQSTKQASAKMSAQLVRSRCRLVHKHYGIWAGIMLRFATISIYGLRLTRWLVTYVLRRKSRLDTSSKIEMMWKVIRAAISC